MNIPKKQLETVSLASAAQAKHNLENTYRTSTGTTAFRVQDPDPNAVDGGKVLGVRFDVFSTATSTFETPYYILLHCPWPGSQDLRVHKHTIPAFIPLQSLLAKHLPPPGKQKGGKGQNLTRLVREVRGELVAHRKRVEAVERLYEEGKEQKMEVRMLDSSGRELEIRWEDGAVAKVKVLRDGVVDGAVARLAVEEGAKGAGKRMADVERRILGSGVSGRREAGRVEGLVQRLSESSRDS